MPEFRVSIGRKTYDYLDIIVEADTREDADIAAKTKAIAMRGALDWEQGDCVLVTLCIREAS